MWVMCLFVLIMFVFVVLIGNGVFVELNMMLLFMLVVRLSMMLIFVVWIRLVIF